MKETGNDMNQNSNTEKDYSILDDFNEVEIVGYLRDVRGLPISLIGDMGDIGKNRSREYNAFAGIITEGCVFSTKYEIRFTASKYKITKIIQDPFDLGVKPNSELEFYGLYDETTKLFNFIGGGVKEANLVGTYIIGEVEKVSEPEDYVEYLKTIDPTVLRVDYKEGFEKACEEYGILIGVE
jgi:hypothetical protein